MLDSDDETENQWLEECKLFSRGVTVKSDHLDKIVEEMKFKDQEEYNSRDTFFIEADNELEESVSDMRLSVQPPDEEKWGYLGITPVSKTYVLVLRFVK